MRAGWGAGVDGVQHAVGNGQPQPLPLVPEAGGGLLKQRGVLLTHVSAPAEPPHTAGRVIGGWRPGAGKAAEPPGSMCGCCYPVTPCVARAAAEAEARAAMAAAVGRTSIGSNGFGKATMYLHSPCHAIVPAMMGLELAWGRTQLKGQRKGSSRRREALQRWAEAVGPAVGGTVRCGAARRAGK